MRSNSSLLRAMVLCFSFFGATHTYAQGAIEHFSAAACQNSSSLQLAKRVDSNRFVLDRSIVPEFTVSLIHLTDSEGDISEILIDIVTKSVPKRHCIHKVSLMRNITSSELRGLGDQWRNRLSVRGQRAFQRELSACQNIRKNPNKNKAGRLMGRKFGDNTFWREKGEPNLMGGTEIAPGCIHAVGKRALGIMVGPNVQIEVISDRVFINGKEYR